MKLTFTFSAAGTFTPLFVTITGLNTRVLGGRNHLLIKINGLCVIGGGVNVDNPSEGYVLFMAAQPNADLVRYTHYKQNILLPFVTKSCVEFDGYIPGTPILD